MAVSRKRWGERKAGAPPVGEPFVWHTLELVRSAAWRGRSINCVRLLEFLEIELMKHGGTGNGSLLAPYSQLVAFGIGRRLINGAIKEAVHYGLLRVARGGLRGRAMSECNRYRLTYLWKKALVDGLWDFEPPTDEWKAYQEPENCSLSCTVSVHQDAQPSTHLHALPHSQAIDISGSIGVHLDEHPSISRVGRSSAVEERGRSAPSNGAVASPRALERLAYLSKEKI